MTRAKSSAQTKSLQIEMLDMYATLKATVPAVRTRPTMRKTWMSDAFETRNDNEQDGKTVHQRILTIDFKV